MEFNMQLPVWMVSELSKHSDKSTQYIIKKILKDVLVSEEGERILVRIGEEE